MSVDTQLSWFECLEDDEQWQQYEAMLKSQNAADATSTPNQSIQMNMNPDPIESNQSKQISPLTMKSLEEHNQRYHNLSTQPNQTIDQGQQPTISSKMPANHGGSISVEDMQTLISAIQGNYYSEIASQALTFTSHLSDINTTTTSRATATDDGTILGDFYSHLLAWRNSAYLPWLFGIT